MSGQEKQVGNGLAGVPHSVDKDTVRQIGLLSSRIEKIERRWEQRTTKAERAHKASLMIATCSGVFLGAVGVSVLVRSWLSAFGVISLERDEFRWLLGYDALLLVLGVSILGICLAVSSHLSRDD